MSEFVYGAATASYQIEGAWNEDGKGPNIWDVLAPLEGHTVEGQTGVVACDHYHKWREDVALMKELGIKAYRFSLSWARILPEGTGKVNEAGIKFYSDLIDALLENGITPYVTLYHWDLPYALHQKGGWLNPEIQNWFAEYTKVVMDAFSDRVTHWITQNEPQCFIGLAYRTGKNAPFYKLTWKEVLEAGKNSMLAHGRAVQVIRKYAKKKPTVGYTVCGTVGVPATNTERDWEAARRDTFVPSERSLFVISMFLDPVLFGRYPEGAEAVYSSDLPAFTEEERKIITAPIDFIGVNEYSGHRVMLNKNGQVAEQPKIPGRPQNQLGWDIEPESIYCISKLLCERYQKPVIITENGFANADLISGDGKVHDPQRIEYLDSYLSQLQKAVDEGIPVLGYFYWSLMDNYEWQHGYSPRFGLIYVDYGNNCKRIKKDSFYWYQKYIQSMEQK